MSTPQGHFLTAEVHFDSRPAPRRPCNVENGSICPSRCFRRFGRVDRAVGADEGPLSETPVATVNAIQGALEKAGVEFTNGNQPGVRRKSSGGSIPVEELNASNDD